MNATYLGRVTPETRRLIDQAVAEGRVNRLPSVDASLLPASAAKVHPLTCGPGERVKRLPRLDEIDTWYFS